jgi:hypothetical protein
MFGLAELRVEVKGSGVDLVNGPVPLNSTSSIAGETEVVYISGDQSPIDIQGMIQNILLDGSVSYQDILGELSKYINTYGAVAQQTLQGNITSAFDWFGAVAFINLLGHTDESQYVDIHNYPWLDFSNERNSMYLGVL